MRKNDLKGYTSYQTRVLRDRLRQRAVAEAGELSRSVARLASADAKACEDYGEEVSKQHVIAERLLYLQHCRSALERCIAGGRSSLRYRWMDGHVTVTWFVRVSRTKTAVKDVQADVTEGAVAC